MCHSDYLDGFFAAVQFTPFELEGKAKECIHRKGIIVSYVFLLKLGSEAISIEYYSSKSELKAALCFDKGPLSVCTNFTQSNIA